MYKKILIIRIGNIGDVLFVTPLIRKLRAHFPESQVDVLTSPQASVVLTRNPYINSVFIYEKYHKVDRWFKRKLFLRKLKLRGYDLCVVLESNLEYLKFARAACERATRIGIGSAHSKEFLSKEAPFLQTRHAVENYLALLQLLDIHFSRDDLSMDFFVEDTPAAVASDYVIVHPNCTRYDPFRGWPIDRFAQLIEYFTKKGVTVYVTGSARDIESDKLLKNFQGRDLVKGFIGKDLLEVAKLIKNAKLVVCCDTGILHLTQALHGKLVALFGPSDPKHTGPVGPGSYKVVRKPFDCGPCNYYPEYHKEQKAQCMRAEYVKCMNGIELKDVLGAIEEIGEIQKH